MPINEVATQKVLRGLKCPYTGETVSVRVIAADGQEPRFFSPDAFDPSAPHPTVKALLDAAGRRDGVSGLLSPEKSLICPYTGKGMAIIKMPDGYCLTGGFSPSRPVPGAGYFAWLMKCRDGKNPEPCPEKAKVEFKEDVPERRPVSDGKPKDYALKHAEEALKDTVLRAKPSVSAPGPVGRRKRDK